MIVRALIFFAGFFAKPNAKLPGQVIDITAGNYFFQVPATIRPGLTTLRLHTVGEGGHQLNLYKLPANHTAAEFISASAAKQPTPWATEMGGPGFPPPNGSVNATYVLEPGRYVILCAVHDQKDGKAHYQKGMYSEITVAGKRVAGKLPTPDITVTEVDNAWRFSKAITAGRHILRVTNAGKEFHELKILRVLPGYTAAQSLAWKPGQPPMDEQFATVTVMAPGVSVTTTIDFPAGAYTLFCVPQIKHGMTEALLVH